MRLSCFRIPPRGVLGANPLEIERGTGGPQGMAMPVELRLEEFRRGRRLDGWRGDRGCRHSCRLACDETRVTDDDQKEYECQTSSEYPEMASRPTHQFELSRMGMRNARASSRPALRILGHINDWTLLLLL